MAEGNGQFKPVEIDVTDDMAFRSGVVQYMQIVMDRTSCISDMKKKVDNHDSIVRFGKWLSAPLFLLLQFLFKHPVEKLWDFFK